MAPPARYTVCVCIYVRRCHFLRLRLRLLRTRLCSASARTLRRDDKAPTPSTVPMLPTTATRQDRNVDCGLGAVVEVIRAAPRVAKGRKSVRDGKDDEVEVGSLIYGKQELAVSFFKMCYSA